MEALSEDVNMYSSGYKMENGHIVKLSLYYQYNLETLPEEISNLKFLEELQLSNCNRFQNFPKSIEKLENLKSLKLIRLYNLEALPSAIYNLENLQTLVLDYLNISEIPKEIKNLRALEELEVLNCSKITTLPEEISNIPNLQRAYAEISLAFMPRRFAAVESLLSLRQQIARHSRRKYRCDILNRSLRLMYTYTALLKCRNQM